jgi:YD repeat-containing protein
LRRDALNGETRYAYDLLGNRTRVTDAEGRVTQFVFDDMGRLKEVRDPLIESPTDLVTRMAVDEAGNVIERTDRKGQLSRFSYDNLNRLTRAEYADGAVVTQAYDVWGDLISRGDANVSYTLDYDVLHRPYRRTDSRLGGKRLEYGYDRLGRAVVRTDYDGSRTDYQYDGSGRLVATTNSGYVAGVYQQDAAGRLLQRGLSNGARTRYSYDANGWLASLSNTTDLGTVVNASQYTRDRTGRVLTDITAAGTTSYSCDALYRLIGADYPGAANDESFTYDRVGNRKTHAKAGITRHTLHDANNRLTRTDSAPRGRRTRSCPRRTAR